MPQIVAVAQGDALDFLQAHVELFAAIEKFSSALRLRVVLTTHLAAHRSDDLGRLLKNPAAKTLELLADKPFPSEAEAFGRFPFTYDQYHAEVSEIAPAFSPGGALRMLLPAALRPKRRTLWMQGTLTRSLGSFARLTLPFIQWRTTLVNLLQRNG